MIFMTLCNRCMQPFQIHIKPDETSLIDQIVDDEQTCKCPRLCGGRVILEKSKTLSEMATDPRARTPLHLTGTQLFQAVNGMGCPDEIPKDATVLEALLRAYTITAVAVRENQGSIFLDQLVLSDGTTIHLVSGGGGAQVLKITKKEDPHGSASNR